MRRYYNIGRTVRARRNRTSKDCLDQFRNTIRTMTTDKGKPLSPGELRHARAKSTNARKQAKLGHANKEKFGIKIPNTPREALIFDGEARNTKWADSMAKEMNGLIALNVFQFHSAGTRFRREDGWQWAPMRMIFDIKKEDKRYKSRFVVGSHVID